MTIRARRFLSGCISRLVRKERKPHQQAIAICFSKARKKGFKVPKAR